MNIDQWVIDATRGDKVVYYTGFMAEDIVTNQEAKQLCKKINEYCKLKLITVTQRALQKGHFKSVYEYIAFKL
jgi:hypothetical protein